LNHSFISSFANDAEISEFNTNDCQDIENEPPLEEEEKKFELNNYSIPLNF